jgi:hypothetical protein
MKVSVDYILDCDVGRKKNSKNLSWLTMCNQFSIRKSPQLDAPFVCNTTHARA